MSKRRLFLGFGVSPDLAKVVGDWQRLHSRWPVRFTGLKNLHITLVSPWEDHDLETAKEMISTLPLPSTGPLNFRFSSVSLGPDPEEPKLIWASAETPRGFPELKYRLEEKLWLPHDKRPLRPHLTIARFRSEDTRRLPQKMLMEIVDWPLTATKFILFESRSGKNGLEYNPLVEFPLK